jgi:RNA polymerase sigma factor (sigma-70 family)
MHEPEPTPHLSRISTRWDLLFQAHLGKGEAAAKAQEALLRRYWGAIYRYLLAVVREPNVAEDLAQEFALRFVSGAFKRADPELGRFRDFVKKALYHLVVDFQRREQGRPRPLPPDAVSPAGSLGEMDSADQKFIDCWRQELLRRTWEGLAAVEAKGGNLFHTVLRWRVENPETPSTQLAEKLEAQFGKPVKQGTIRVTLHRARERFADLLIDEVARSLQTSDVAQMEQELIDLDLLAYCAPALERRKRET